MDLFRDKLALLEKGARGNPAALLTLAAGFQKNGEGQKALELCRQAMAMAPDDAKLQMRAKTLISDTVPPWHFVIVKDAVRNAAYDTALRRAMTPQSRVLEIGTGTGLLAMMAARAGAASVTTCEMSPAVAEKAAEIVTRNGYADKVRVVAKHSGTVDAETDMGGRADILVSEIVSNDLLGEKVLVAHERALRDLLKPGAQVIPRRGAVRVALAHDSKWAKRRLDEVDGFDLSVFNSLVRPVEQMPVGDERLALRGPAADLFGFDFANPAYCGPAVTSRLCRSDGGPVNGVAQWIALEMDDVTHYENRPMPGAKSCWAALFYSFPQTIETVPGQELRIGGAHDRSSISIWLAEQD